jgi:hypothetical protein
MIINRINTLAIAIMAVIAIGINGCKEVGPQLPWGNTSVISDTTYIEHPVASPDTKNVFIEMQTGVSCPNCPQGHAVLDQLLQTYHSRVVAMAYHSNKPGAQDESISGITTQVLSCPDAQAVIDNFGDPGGRPSAAIDRIPHNDLGPISIYADYTNWIQYTQTQLGIATPVNINLSKVYDPSSKTVTVSAELHYTASQVDSQKLSIFLTEDSIVTAQENGASHYDTFYVHNAILRKALTNPNGDIMKVTLTAGTVIKRIYTYQITNPMWKSAHMNIVAFVHKNGNPPADVLQATSIKLQ